MSFSSLLWYKEKKAVYSNPINKERYKSTWQTLRFECSDTFLTNMSFVCEIKFGGRKKMLSRGSWTANSILKQAAYWSNCCSFVSKTTQVFLWCFALKWQTPLMHRTGIRFSFCRKKTMQPENPHYEVVGFFCS